MTKFKIGIDPSGTGTTVIAVYKNGSFYTDLTSVNKDWKLHYSVINNFCKGFGDNAVINIEKCVYTMANGSKDRDDLLKLIGALEISLENWENIYWITPNIIKNKAKNMENESRFNEKKEIQYNLDNNLTYQHGKGWKYKDNKITKHLRDAIILALIEGEGK